MCIRDSLNETLSRVFSDIESSANGADSEDDLKGAVYKKQIVCTLA